MVILAGVFSACSKEDPTLFEGESDGFYFNYDSKDDLTSTINFADSVVTERWDMYLFVSVSWVICQTR